MANPDDPLIGVVLKDTFTIEEQIGAGGMGSVYRAIQRPLDRPVAIKVLSGATLPSQKADMEKRFYREAKLLSELAHPHIVGILDFGSTPDGLIYMVMEYLKGEDLQEQIPASGMPVARVRELFGQICAGVGAAHSHGLVHRDLKPANVFLARVTGDSEVVKILDFGIAKAVGEADQGLTQGGVMMGTPGYIAPEQIEDSASADHRCDIYALGAILYLLLTGRKAYEGRSAHAIMSRQIMDPPELIDFAASGLPVGLSGLILKAMAIDPEERYQTAAELLEDLDAVLAGRPLASTSAGMAMPTIPAISDPALSPTMPQPAQTTPPQPETYPGQLATGQYPGQPGQLPTGQYPGQLGQLPTGQYPGQPGQLPTGQYPGQMPTGLGPMGTQMPTQMPTQMVPAQSGVRFVVAVVVVLVIVFGGGAAVLLGTGVLDRGPTVSEGDVQKVADEARSLRDKLVQRKQSSEADLAEASEAVARLEQQLASAAPDRRAALDQELQRARQEQLYHQGVLDLGGKLVFGGSPWSAVTTVLERGEARLAKGEYGDAKDAFEAAKLRLAELGATIVKVEALQQAHASAQVARARWDVVREAARPRSLPTEAARAGDAMRTADDLASDGIFDQARSKYEMAVRLYDEARASSEKALSQIRAASDSARREAQRARQALDELLADRPRPDSAKAADKAHAAALAQLEAGKLAEAAASLRAVVKTYDEIADGIRQALAAARSEVERIRASAEEQLREIELMLAPGELKAPPVLGAARDSLERGRQAASKDQQQAALDAFADASRKLSEALGALKANLTADRGQLADARGRWKATTVRASEAMPIATESLRAQHQRILDRTTDAEKAAKNGRLRAASQMYDELRGELVNWSAQVYYTQGLANYENESYDKAVEFYQKAHELVPDRLVYLIKLGEANYSQGKLDIALETLAKVVTREPNNRDANITIGLCHAAKESWAKGAAAFRKAVAADGDYWISNYYLGLMLIQLGKKSEAVAALQDALQTAPKSQRAKIEQLISSQR